MIVDLSEYTYQGTENISEIHCFQVNSSAPLIGNHLDDWDPWISVIHLQPLPDA